MVEVLCPDNSKWVLVVCRREVAALTKPMYERKKEGPKQVDPTS